jgi:hypothetical protein
MRSFRVLLFVAASAQCTFCQSILKSSSVAFGSAVVAIIRDDTIAVAADSRTNSDGALNPDTTCKIAIVNNVIFAATGLLYGSRTTPGIVEFARNVLSGDGKIDTKLSTFQKGASDLLAQWLNAPNYFDSLGSSSQYGYFRSVHTLFCFFSGKDPVVIEYAFIPSRSRGNIVIGGYQDAGRRKSREMHWIGAMEQTDTLLKKNVEFYRHIQSTDAVSAGQALITKQMEFTPKIVGGDIDIAVVTSKGAGWVHKKQRCE